MTDELKPCPFCGAIPILDGEGEPPIVRVRCLKCNLATLWSTNAVSIWNTRKSRHNGLLPCPMCGKKAKLFKCENGFSYVRCSNCFLMTQDYRDKEEAIGAWNRRINS